MQVVPRPDVRGDFGPTARSLGASGAVGHSDGGQLSRLPRNLSLHLNREFIEGCSPWRD